MEIEWLLFARDMGRNQDGTRNLIGLFDNLVLPGPPYWGIHIIVTTGLYIQPSEERSIQMMRLDVVYQDNGETIGSVPLRYEVHPLPTLIEMGFTATWRLPLVEFPYAGAYDFKVYVDDEFKVMRTMRVISLEEANEILRGGEGDRLV